MDNRIRRRFKQIFDEKQDRFVSIPGTLGDNNNNLRVSDLDNYVYVRTPTGVEEVLCTRIIPRLGLQVNIGRDDVEPDKYQVLGIRTYNTGGIISGTIETGYTPATRYQWMALTGGQDPLFVELRQFMPLRVGTYLNMLIQIYQGAVKTATGWVDVLTQTKNMEPYVPTTSGKAALVLITVDEDGVIVATKGDEFNIEDVALSYIPAAPTGTLMELAVVRVYYGQTAVQESRVNTDIKDLRFGSAGSGGPTTDTMLKSVYDTDDDGIIDVAALGTGTPDGSKFLRDDGTWDYPPQGDMLKSVYDANNDGIIDPEALGDNIPASGLFLRSDGSWQSTGYAIASTLLSDNFNRVDSATVGNPTVGNPPTVIYSGGVGDWGITSNALVPKSFKNEHRVLWNVGAFEYILTATIKTQFDDGGIIVRHLLSTDYTNDLVVYSNPGLRYELYSYQTGTGYTLLTYGGSTPADGDIVEVRVLYSGIRVKVNGTEVYNYGTTLFSNGMFVGFRSNGATGGAIEDVSVQTMAYNAEEAFTTDQQITSGVPAGTAPFVIASNTLNANLNADLLDGLDSTAFQLVGAPAAGVELRYLFCEDVMFPSTTPVWHELEPRSDGGITGSHTATGATYSEMDRYVTEALGTTIIPGGMWSFHLFSKVSAASRVGQLKAEVYRVNSSGVIVGSALGTAETAEFTNTTVTENDCMVYIAEQTGWAVTDRIGVVISGKRGVAAATVTFYHDISQGWASAVECPIVLLHNQMQGLNDGDYKHLTAAEYGDLVPVDGNNDFTYTDGLLSDIDLSSGAHFDITRTDGLITSIARMGGDTLTITRTDGRITRIART